MLDAMARIEMAYVEQAEDLAESSTESFDRMEFAERAIALVRPVAMTVALCEGSRRVRVEAGRQWGARAGARWAIVSVPHNASRRAITTAVLGLFEGSGKAWTLDVLMSDLGSAPLFSSPRRP